MKPLHLLTLVACLSMPAEAQTPAGVVQLGRFSSAALGVQRNYFVYLPPAYRTSPLQHFPVVYLLHGYAGDEAEWITHGDIAVVADSLIASGTAPFILVLPDGDRGYWVNWEQ